ncbi:GPW/gp25 family protein [Oligella urethralis]|uniref:GPW/gp25 family protein n=1 Tax=Oligella urethralis TaxID=90245 RepID=UPI00056ACAB2|nr:GPW/gp25 family protein [Oligella urethralis]SUA58138.1 Gene 25-like lysozyme [Oligella urethralis]
MTLLSDIQSLHWQPKRGESGVVENINDIDQCIRTILLTAKGSDIHRPLFGSDIYQYIDRPIDQAKPYIVREIVEACLRWEPRCVVVRVDTYIEAEQMFIKVAWKLTEDINEIIHVTVVEI